MNQSINTYIGNIYEPAYKYISFITKYVLQKYNLVYQPLPYVL